MTEKRENPYRRLQRIAREWAFKAAHPRTVRTLLFKHGVLPDQIWQRIKAGEQLGYKVEVCAIDDGLAFNFVKKTPERPWELRG